MQAVDHEVLNQVAIWLRDGKRCWLSTVVATYGSSPRPEGSVMACDTSGIAVGSLSGGCVEEDLLEKLTNGLLARSESQFFRYGETAEEAERLGLPCGGHLDIVVEPLDPDFETVELFSTIANRLDQRQRVTRHADYPSDTIEIEESDELHPFSYDGEHRRLTQTYGPRYQLFIIGSGMVSQYVAELAQMLDYQVTVIDPREENLNAFNVLGVVKACDMPDDVLLARANDSQSAIVALTHDPRIDDMGLMGAFDTPAFYIGAMGSERTTANRLIRLEALGIEQEQLDRLHAPIGLAIGSKTPPEIAVSIMAEITAVRHAVAIENSVTAPQTESV